MWSLWLLVPFIPSHSIWLLNIGSGIMQWRNMRILEEFHSSLKQRTSFGCIPWKARVSYPWEWKLWGNAQGYYLATQQCHSHVPTLDCEYTWWSLDVPSMFSISEECKFILVLWNVGAEKITKSLLLTRSQAALHCKDMVKWQVKIELNGWSQEWQLS